MGDRVGLTVDPGRWGYGEPWSVRGRVRGPVATD